MIFAGIDGGATRTRAALASDDGTIVGFGEAGPSNYDNVGVETARENIKSAVNEAWKATGRPMRPCDGAFCGMAGVVSEQDRETIRTIARDIGLAPGRKRRSMVIRDQRTSISASASSRFPKSLLSTNLIIFGN